MNVATGKIDQYVPLRKSNGKYIISWGLSPNGKDSYKWMYFISDLKPTLESIRNEIESYINNETKKAISERFTWNGMSIFLSMENQIDYKLLYDVTVMQDGANLPAKLRFKVDGEYIYYEIETIDEFKDFMIAMNNHIRTALNSGYAKKESIDYNEYIQA